MNLSELFGREAARQSYTEDLADDRPVTMQYHRNTTPAPRQVNHYHGQDIEPHGQYFSQGPMHGDVPGYETGEKSFQRPLRLFSPTDDPSQPHHWKQQLQRRYNATGKALSQAIRDDGYDAILTHDEYGPSESVDLTSFKSRKTAAEDPGVYRGLSLVLPPHIHKMVHDPEQPTAARAHLLLSEIRKQKEGHQGEDATGETGGLGSFWSPHQHKAEEYATQSGFGAYNEHEREHNCGDPDYGDGGCPTTRVVVHAQTPPEKHHWKEIFRPGERYDPEISWRLPVRPGTPMHVRGISWREGNDNQPSDVKYSEEGMRSEKTPYQSHDFLREVRKQASAPPGTMGKDSEGHRVQMTTMDGWAHDDGSHGHEDNSTIGDHPVYTQDHTWLPEGRYWGPNSAQNDQRLFEGDHLRPEVREDLLSILDSFMRPRYREWPSWTKAYFAGSQAARWLDESGRGNGDFDMLIGIDFDKFRQHNPSYAGDDDEAIAKMLTDGMHRSINDDAYHPPV